MAEPPFTSNMQIIEHVLGPLAGRRILDIGCGGGRLLRALHRRGAKVSGIDPSEEMIARAGEMVPDASLHCCGAEELPFADHAFEGAVILNSLHHFPVEQMQAALEEALRVIAPGASLLVIEPVARGGYHEVFAPIDDETVIRAIALRELAAFIERREARRSFSLEYPTWVKEKSVEAMLDYGRAVDPRRAARIKAAEPTVRALFERHAQPCEGGFKLEQPMIATALTLTKS